MTPGAHRHHLARSYWLNIAANLLGFIVIIVLSLFTPLAFIKSNKAIFFQGGWLPALLIISTLELLVGSLGFSFQYRVQRPLSASLRYLERQREAPAGCRILNLPFILAADLETLGRFMILFFLRIETHKKQLKWVRAGHDPAILYDPASDSLKSFGDRASLWGLIRHGAV